MLPLSTPHPMEARAVFRRTDLKSEPSGSPLSLVKDIRSVSHYLLPIAGSISRVALVHRARVDAAPARLHEQALNGSAPTCALLCDLLEFQTLDGPGRFPVQLLGGVVVVEVAEVRADDDETFGTAPQQPDDLARLSAPVITWSRFGPQPLDLRHEGMRLIPLDGNATPPGIIERRLLRVGVREREEFALLLAQHSQTLCCVGVRGGASYLFEVD